MQAQWRIQGGPNPAMAPIEVGNGVWPPLGSRKSNDSIANLSKCKDLGPRIDVGYGFAPPPYGKIGHLRHEKVHD